MIRLTRGKAFRDKLRAYKIYIDDVYRGDIRQNKTIDFQVENGRHVIYAKIDWYTSNRLTVEINYNTVELEVVHADEIPRELKAHLSHNPIVEAADALVSGLTEGEREGWLYIRKKGDRIK